MRRGGLGRGLSSLIPPAGSTAAAGGLVEIPIEAISANPRQPRKGFPDPALESLARSIEEVGVLQPVVVRARGEGYELVAGERRVRAARMAGLGSVPAVVREGGDDESLREALIENIHREDLSPLELAAALQELLGEPEATQESVAKRLGYSRAHVANTVRLLSLPPDVQRLLADDRIQAGHARALLSLPDEEARSTLALRIAAEGLSVRAVEEAVKRYTTPRPSRSSGPKPPDPSLIDVEATLSERLGTRVRVAAGKRKGRLVIEFGSRDDLTRIVADIVGATATPT